MQAGFSLKDSTIGIIGLGLMGGSLAMNLKGKCARLIGFDSHPPTLELALAKNIVDQARPHPQPLSQGEREVNILILATPVPSIIEIIYQLSRSIPVGPRTISHPCIVMDLGSTKRDIVTAMSALPEYFDPIGGHPICGRERLGLENADADLYRNAPFVITPLERTTQRARSAAQQILSIIGANPIEMNPEDHDLVLASTSHLPYLLASALVNSTPPESKSLIGPGFRSAARLADTPASMMMGVLQSNRDNILNSIRSFQNSLVEIESALQNENYSQLEGILKRSRGSYHALIEN